MFAHLDILTFHKFIMSDICEGCYVGGVKEGVCKACKISGT